jgi:hypothetical protein
MPQPAGQQVRRNPAQQPQRPQRQAPAPVQPDPEPEADDLDEDPFAPQAVGNGDWNASDDEDLPDVINLEDAPDAPERRILRPGNYLGYVDTVEYGRGAKGPMLTWLLRLSDPETGEDVPISFWTSFSEGAISRSKKTLKRLAPDLDFRSFNPHEAQDLFGGMNIRARVRVRTNPPDHDYPGPQNNVRDIEPAPEQFLEQ